MQEWGLFNDESANWTEGEAVETGFWSREEAEQANRDRYSPDSELTVHQVEDTELELCESCGGDGIVEIDGEDCPDCEGEGYVSD